MSVRLLCHASLATRREAGEVLVMAESIPEPAKPMTLRMFVDDIAGVGLWPDWAWDYPGSPFAYLFEDEPETLLSISGRLRDDIRAWVDEYTATLDEPRRAFEWAEHDRRGRRLSERLQTELNADDFRVQYKPHTRKVLEESME